jgi:glutamate racemase
MIGVIDFGIGGLTVVEALRKRWPAEDLVYLGDTAGVPGGDSRPERIVGWTAASAARLERWGAAVMVLASHTAACLLAEDPSWRPGIPVIDVLSSAVQTAAAVSRRQCIGVVGSRPVVESARHAALLRERIPGTAVVTAVCPLWALLVSEGWGKRRETAMVVKRDLRPIRARRVDTLILGSSYFVRLRPLIQRKMGPQVTVVDPAETAARLVAEWVSASGAGDRRSGAGRGMRLLVSELTPRVQRAALDVVGHPVALESAD